MCTQLTYHIYNAQHYSHREIDRKDLAIQLRKRLGDYSRVVQLLQTGMWCIVCMYSGVERDMCTNS